MLVAQPLFPRGGQEEEGGVIDVWSTQALKNDHALRPIWVVPIPRVDAHDQNLIADVFVGFPLPHNAHSPLRLFALTTLLD